MPFQGKHAARILDPSQFKEFRVDSEPEGFPEGIEVVYGIREDESSDIQGFRFDSEKFTEDEAKAWLEEQEMEVLEFEPAAEEEPDEEEEVEMGAIATPPIALNLEKSEESTSRWHLLLPQGEVVYDSFGTPIATDPESLTHYSEQFTEYTRGGEYLPPALYNHDVFGEAGGDLLECRYFAEGPQGAGLYFNIDWHPDVLEAIDSEKWRYASVSLWPDVIDWDGKEYDILPMEVSVTNIPQVTTLPKLSEGVAELNRRVALSRRPPESEPVVEPDPVEPTELSKVKAMLAKLEEENVSLKRERSMGVVTQDIADGYWTVKDDVKRSSFAKLVELHLRDPKTYAFVKSMSPRVEREAVRLGERGSDINHEVVSFRKREDMMTFWRDRSKALSAEKGISYTDAYRQVRAKYPESEILEN